MSEVQVIDPNGFVEVIPGTVKPIKGDNPAYRARIALALPVNTWLYAPGSGHNLKQFDIAKASDSNKENFIKSVKLYLAPYGPSVISRYIARGLAGITTEVTKQTIYG